jgi:simple sugar transport system substrate-binding protein
MITRRFLFGAAVAMGMAGSMVQPAMAADPVLTGEGMTIYFQMGGNPGDSATLARELGAKAAADLLKVKLMPQYAGWDQQKMLEQANQALAAQPDAIVVMGHSGTDSMQRFLNEATEAGTVVVTNNTRLPGTGLSYFGLDNYAAGKLLGEQMIAAGLKSGDKAVIYGTFEQTAHADISRGTIEAFDAAGITYDKLQWSNEAVQDPSLAVPVIASYLQSNPDVKAIAVPGHSGITAVLAKVMEAAGKEPGSLVTGGYDISPLTIDGLRKGYVTVVVDQQPYLQGYMPVLAAVLQKRYGIAGLEMNTGGGVFTKDNFEWVVPLVEQGVR